jgi:hypothetical protein
LRNELFNIIRMGFIFMSRVSPNIAKMLYKTFFNFALFVDNSCFIDRNYKKFWDKELEGLIKSRQASNRLKRSHDKLRQSFSDDVVGSIIDIIFPCFPYRIYIIRYG